MLYCIPPGWARIEPQVEGQGEGPGVPVCGCPCSQLGSAATCPPLPPIKENAAEIWHVLRNPLVAAGSPSQCFKEIWACLAGDTCSSLQSTQNQCRSTLHTRPLLAICGREGWTHLPPVLWALAAHSSLLWACDISFPDRLQQTLSLSLSLWKGLLP